MTRHVQLSAERQLDLRRFSSLTHESHVADLGHACAAQILAQLVESEEAFRIEGATVTVRVEANVEFSR